jgi:hypothetical protein
VSSHKKRNLKARRKEEKGRGCGQKGKVGEREREREREKKNRFPGMALFFFQHNAPSWTSNWVIGVEVKNSESLTADLRGNASEAIKLWSSAFERVACKKNVNPPKSSGGVGGMGGRLFGNVERRECGVVGQTADYRLQR